MARREALLNNRKKIPGSNFAKPNRHRDSVKPDTRSILGKFKPPKVKQDIGQKEFKLTQCNVPG
jgi:hypothetical protein